MWVKVNEYFLQYGVFLSCLRHWIWILLHVLSFVRSMGHYGEFWLSALVCYISRMFSPCPFKIRNESSLWFIFCSLFDSIVPLQTSLVWQKLLAKSHREWSQGSSSSRKASAALGMKVSERAIFFYSKRSIYGFTEALRRSYKKGNDPHRRPEL